MYDNFISIMTLDIIIILVILLEYKKIFNNAGLLITPM